MIAGLRANFYREIMTMPFSLIAFVLSVGFILVWAFVGAMLLRVGQLAARRDADNSRSEPTSEPEQEGAPRRSQAA